MRILKALVIITVVVTTPVVQARPQYHSAAPVAYMLDMSSGTVLFDQGSDRKIQPASMTKLMTTYVAFDLISRGKLDPGQKIVVRPETWAAWQNTGSTMFLKPNEQVRVSDLLHGVVTLSGNDAAIVLAEGITGSQATFVERMNSTAKRLGMRDSHFETANGWPDQGRTTTTARDLALLGARTIHDFPVLYRQYYGLTRFRWNGIEQPNRNPILGKIDGADGIKTGHTNGAGYCFIGTAEQHGRRLLIVVAGLESSGDRAFESVRFLNWGFKEWRTQQLYKRGSPVTKIPVQLGTQSSVLVVAPRSLSVTLPTKGEQPYKMLVRYRGPVKAPFEKGTELAQLIVKFSDGSEQSMPLASSSSVAQAGFLGRAWNGVKSLVGG